MGRRNSATLLDEDGIIRCYERMTIANLPQETITSIFLPRKEKFVELITEEYSILQFLKLGQNIGLYVEGQKFWRNTKDAVRCQFKIPAILLWQKNKLTRSPPFKHTGVAYFGPQLVKLENRKKKKGWLCLVTCFVVKALHLDVVDDLTVEVFLMRLRRFIAKSHL